MLSIAAGKGLRLLKVASFPTPAHSAHHSVRVMARERWFEEWVAGLPFLLRYLLLSVVMLSGAGLAIAIRVVVGHISADLSGLIPVVIFVLVIAFVGAVAAGRRS